MCGTLGKSPKEMPRAGFDLIIDGFTKEDIKR